MALQLDAVAAELNAVSGRARSVVERVGTAQLCERPASGGWSIAEIFEHLNMTTRSFVPRWEQACGEARDRGWKSEGPYRTDLWGKMLVWMLDPPYRIKMPT